MPVLLLLVLLMACVADGCVAAACVADGCCCCCCCLCSHIQQEGYELLETHDGQGALVIVDYLVKTALGNLQVG
jgi:hypothetical protein